MITTADAAPLPEVFQHPEERAWEQRLGDVLREATRAARKGGTHFVLRGGTAGRLGCVFRSKVITDSGRK